MKCLSICQPFADLIVDGKKTIELRTWNTNFRGEFLIHSAKKIREVDCRRLKIPISTLTTGAIIGKVELVNVKEYKNKLEIKEDAKKHLANHYAFKNKYGFMLKNPKKFSANFPCKGKLNFFEFDPDVLKIDDIKIEMFEEEQRYKWINHH